MRNHLVPIIPTIERLGRSRQESSRAAGAQRGGGDGKGGTISPPALDGPRPRPRTTAPTNRRRDHQIVAAVDGPLPHPPRRGTLALGNEEEEAGGFGLNHNSNYYRRPGQKSQRGRAGARTTEPSLVAARRRGGRDGSRGFGIGSDSKRSSSVADSSDTWPGFLGQIVPSGVEAIAGLPLSGDERDEFATKALAAAAVISRSPAGAADRNSRGRRRPSVHQFQSTQDHGGPEREGFPGATTTAAPSLYARETAGKVANAYSALAPPLSLAKVAAGESGARPTAPQQQEATLCSQQWGGFGPGHTPKYFRGKFGVAGERKRLLRRQTGDSDVD